jgi:hypothetical protein
MLTNRARAAALLIFAGPLVSQAATSITALGQSSSVVMIGALAGLENGPAAGQFTLTLSVATVLKGQIGASTVVAALVPTDAYVLPSVIPSSQLGQAGIWFLSQTAAGYQVVPTQAGQFLPDELFLPLTPSLAAATFSGSIEQQLLQYVIGWYQSLPSPTVRDDMKCLAALQSESTVPQDALAAANLLIGSPAVNAQVVGLSAAIGLGSDNAVAALSALLGAVGSSPKLYLVTSALAIGYQPHGAASVPVLKQIIDQHSAVPGIDAAAGAALSKIVVKQALPVMAELLNSSDPAAQLRAASFFGLFTLFADSSGTVSGGGPMGPFATDQTRQYTPRKNSGITPHEYSAFWQQWWAQNHNVFGL